MTLSFVPDVLLSSDPDEELNQLPSSVIYDSFHDHFVAVVFCYVIPRVVFPRVQSHYLHGVCAVVMRDV